MVAITLASFAWVIYRAITSRSEGLAAGFSDVRPAWLAVAALFALQEGVCGGLRIFVLGRVTSPRLSLGVALRSEFVLMFVAGVTPGQVGAPLAQVAVLANAGMSVAEVATAEILTAACTMVFFLSTGLTVVLLRARGLLVVDGAARLDWLIGTSVVVFGSAVALLALCAATPGPLKAVFAVAGRALGPVARAVVSLLTARGRLARLAAHPLARPGALTTRLLHSVDHLHRGFETYRRRGKVACAIAFALTCAFFCSRFAVAYFLLLGLGISTTPDRFVADAPAIVQVVLVQAVLNFALYLSPTPGASGIAEVGSNTLMSPWVRGVHVLPFLVLWRLFALFLSMFVGGVIVFRYLGTDVLEQKMKEAEAARDAELDAGADAGAAGAAADALPPGG